MTWSPTPIESVPAQFYLLRARHDLRDPGSAGRRPPPAVRADATASSGCAAARRCSRSARPRRSPTPTEDANRRNEAGPRHRPHARRRRLVPAAAARRWRPPFARPSPPKVWVTGSPRTDLLLCPDDDAGRRPAGRQAAILRRRHSAAAGSSSGLPAARRRRDDRPARASSADDLRLAARAGRDGTTPCSACARRCTRSGDERRRPGTPAATGCRPARARPVGASFPDVEVVLRATAVLVSDYTSELPTSRCSAGPSSATSPTSTRSPRTPGLLHDLADVVAGPVCRRPVGSCARRLGVPAGRRPTPEQAAEHARRARPCCTPTGDGRCARACRAPGQGDLPADRGRGSPPNA